MSADEAKHPRPQAPPPPAPPPDLLAGKAALVTGAGSGLGRGIASGLARAGARVALVDIDLQALGETCAAARTAYRAEENRPRLWPVIALAGVLVALSVPALRAAVKRLREG
jgi:NAD(P)-dependent dehydrogenase (short-subunit alcohol dehydrogenase family)